MTITDLPATWLPLADAILKASIILALAAIASVALKRAAASVRHMVWTLAVCSALLVPALSLALPRWQLPLVTVETAAATAPVPADDQAARPAPPLRRGTSSATEASPSAGTGATSEPARTWRLEISWPSVLFAIWFAGAALILGRMLAGLIVVRLMSRGAERVLDAPWLRMACTLATEVGVSSQITFIRSARAAMPMAWGIFRPSVLMPIDADAWPAERLRIVLLHELAHVKRRDCLTHLVAQIACALYWFNPLVWLAARHIRTERERACDDLVIASGTRGTDYAEELVAIARAMRAGRFPSVLAGATLAMAHRSQLEGRLMAILDPRVPRAGLSRLRTALATLVCVGAVVPLAAVQPWTYTDTNTTGIAAAESSPRETAQTEAGPATNKDEARTAQGTSAAAAAVAEGVQAVAKGAALGAVAGVIEGIASANPNPNPNWNTNSNSNTNHDGKDKDDEAQRAADPKLVAALMAALKDTDREVREHALHALTQLRDPAVFEPLVQALKDAAADIREQAAHGLGQLRDRRAVAPLVAALQDENPGVREQAVHALGQMRDHDAATVAALAGALEDTNPGVREQAAHALGQLRDRQPATIAALTAALKDDNPGVREQVVHALSQLRDPSTIDSLALAMRDQDADVREQAAFALGQIRDARAVEPLISALKDSNPDVREQAAFALGQIRERRAVEALIVALKDADADVREQAAFALGQLRDSRALDALTEALKDQSASVRQQAAFALGQLAR
jgi:HEAT repeat protein/beta-lactamase regulating signal transducer with metallopeptidase domain